MSIRAGRTSAATNATIRAAQRQAGGHQGGQQQRAQEMFHHVAVPQNGHSFSTERVPQPARVALAISPPPW